MLKVLRSPLFRRLFGAVALLALLPLLATALGSSLLVRSLARSKTGERLFPEAILVRDDARPVMEAGDRARAETLVRQLAATTGGARITLVLGDGSVLADSQVDPATIENLAERAEVRSARLLGRGDALRRDDGHEDVVHVAVRADPRNPSLGVVLVSRPVAAFEEELWTLMRRLALVAVPFILVIFAVAAALLGVFSGAVHDLTAAAEVVAAGGSPRRTEAEDRDDEVGGLARAVRAMADELKRQVRALGRERNELATIVRGLGEGLVAIDRRGDVLLFNATAQAIFDLPALPPSGRPLVDVLPHGGVVALAREAVEHGAPRTGTVEVFGARGAGGARSVDVRVTPFSEAPGGEVAGAVVLLRDVTEATRYEQLRSDFVANVSHELRTPLALVKGFLETLEDGALSDPERGPRFLEILRRHVLGLERLVADLLTLSALEAGETRPAEAVSLPDAVESVLGPFEEVFAKRGLRVASSRVPVDLPLVAGHRDHVERALRNLVDNAVKFTPEGGSIEIAGRTQRDGPVELDVRDNGPGIPADSLGRIFERFYRVEKSRSREAGGTGLGLAIVKHIMQQCGGAVSVKSEVGRGTTFTLSFRRAPEDDV